MSSPQKKQAHPSAGPRIQDFLTGTLVRATPEEVHAVQVFARRLVEDYGYPKEYLRVHPQHRVRSRPSDSTKSYPIDIAVFREALYSEENLYMIVECKKPTRKEGLDQLKIYMDMSAAQIGVWFNGQEHEYIHKILHSDGSRTYERLPNIPRYGQRLEDIGALTRADLRKPSNLKAEFRDLRNHLAGMTLGITRDESLAQEIINILFCKILDEQNTAPNEQVKFRVGFNEDASHVIARIGSLFNEVKTATYDDVFDPADRIKLDPDSLMYVVGQLQNYAVSEADRDAIGDAFEVFIGPALRGSEGQFFTPRNVVKMMVGVLDPKPGEKIIDPACGSGGFLIAALEHVWQKVRDEAAVKKWSERQRSKKEIEVATNCFRGIDKDSFLAKVCKAYMALVGDGKGGVYCSNSLQPPNEWPVGLQQKAELGTFDLVLTNPPFGAKIPVKGRTLLGQYKLGHKWETPAGGSSLVPSSQLKDDEAPQVLFIERCIQFLKPGGRMGIVLPEGILGNRRSAYILDYLRSQGEIMGIIDCTRKLFQPHTDTKTNVLFFKKMSSRPDYPVFMSIARTCGHDKRGNQQTLAGPVDDEISGVVEALKSPDPSRLSFTRSMSSMDPYYLVPRYYNPEVTAALEDFCRTTDAELTTIGELESRSLVQISKGHEPGSAAYGTGEIPFIRTSDIANFEITHDPTNSVSEEIYAQYGPKQSLAAGDILFVNDGRYRIGQVCMLTEFDTRVVIQSHFRVIRSMDHDKLDPFTLLYLFNQPVVKLQVEAKTFIQSTIATLGSRLREIILPVPKRLDEIDAKLQRLKFIITERARLRAEARALDSAVEV